MSKLNWVPLSPEGRLIVISGKPADEVAEKWRTRACAWIVDAPIITRDVVRDLLANPQVRAVVFDGHCCNRTAFDLFWLGENDVSWRIDKEHLDLVRQFVDLYDDDCMWRVAPQPFWPARVMYLEDIVETKT